MQVDSYSVLVEAIEEGVRGGLAKCFKRNYLTYNEVAIKHEEFAIEEIHNYVMNAVCEHFNWDDEHEEDRDENLDNVIQEINTRLERLEHRGCAATDVDVYGPGGVIERLNKIEAQSAVGG